MFRKLRNKAFLVPAVIIALAIVIFLEITANGYSDEAEQTRAGSITLPPVEITGGASIEECLANRRSVRRYDGSALTIQEVSQLLWAAYGITQEMEEPAFLRGGLRTAPSAGALYPLEIYLVAGKVDSIPAGVYKYDPRSHKLELKIPGDRRRELCNASGEQIFVEQAPVSIVYSAIYERTTKKYGNRGRERYVCMDLGHSAQNVYLQCVSLGLGTCAVGAFRDEELKKAIAMTAEEEPLYIMPIGRLRQP